MPQAKKVTHVHQYKRIKWGKEGKVVYRCMKDCGHFLSPEFLIGRSAECPVCKETFILTYEDTRRKVPHCDKCRLRSGDITTPKMRAERQKNIDVLKELLLKEVSDKD